MKLTVDRQDSYAIIRIENDKLNTLVAPDLKAKLTVLNGEDIRNIIVDIKEVNFIDSSGLSAILVGNRLCQSANGVLVIAETSKNVKRLIKISQLDSVLRLIPTLQEAKDFIMMNELMRALGGDGEETAETESETIK